jgi:integrase
LAQEKIRHLVRAEGEKTTVDTSHLVYLRECERSVRPYPLHEVCEFFQKFHVVGEKPTTTFGEICEEFYQFIKKRGLETVSTETYRFQTNALTKMLGDKQIQSISATNLEEAFSNSGYAPYTLRQLLATFRMIEKFAKNKRYLARQFESVAHMVPMPRIATKSYPVFTPEQLMRLFMVLNKEEIPYVAIMVFGGSRRAEAQKLTPEKFNMDESSIFMAREIAKKKLPRPLTVTTNMQEWFDIAPPPAEGKLLSHRKVARISSNVARLKSAGIEEWPKNILRHSFLSYHLVKYSEPQTTAYRGGTSIKMLSQHYVGLVSKRTADEWFEITPQKVRSFAAEKGLTHLIQW